MNQIARRSNIHPDEPLEPATLADLTATATEVRQILDILSADV